MTLGQLVNLEQEKLAEEYRNLLSDINEYQRILSDERNIYAIIREDLLELKRRYADPRRTEINGEEIGDVNLDDLIAEETMVVSISSNGTSSTPASAYRAQRGRAQRAKPMTNPIQHLLSPAPTTTSCSSPPGKVYWRVYDLPQLPRDSRGRAIVNLLNLADGERIADCREVQLRRARLLPDDGHQRGLVKDNLPPSGVRRRRDHRHQAREGDELVDVVIARKG